MIVTQEAVAKGRPVLPRRAGGAGSGGGAGATLTVKYPTTADCIPDGGDDASGGGVARVEAAQARGRGQRRHGVRSRRQCAEHCPLEIIGGGAGRQARAMQQTNSRYSRCGDSPRQPELNADSVCCRPS